LTSLSPSATTRPGTIQNLLVSNDVSAFRISIGRLSILEIRTPKLNAKLRWRLVLALLSLSLAYGLLAVFVRVRESVVRFRSEAMYAEFLKLRIGESTNADIEVLRRRFAGSLSQDVDCGRTHCRYTIGNLWGYSRWFLLTQLAHDHLPSSELMLETKGNLLSSAWFSVGVMVPKGYGTREERKRLSDPNYVPYASGEYELLGRAWLVSTLPDTRMTAKQDYRVWGPSGCFNCLAIWVSALPSLAPAKRAQIFDINFTCMTRWSMCTDKEDIMPTAARESAEKLASAYLGGRPEVQAKMSSWSDFRPLGPLTILRPDLHLLAARPKLPNRTSQYPPYLPLA